jgi:hypothetical protein
MFMKIKFLVLMCLILLILAVSPAMFALGEDTDTPPQPYYGEFFGGVKSVEPWNVEGSASEARLVLLENGEGGQASFIVDDVTHMLTDNELKEGAQVTGYYLAGLPMILIYPPRYQAMLMAVDLPQGQFVKAARFNDELISDDNALKLSIGEKTKIELFDGTAAPADLQLGGLRLAVFYGASSKSIPALTTPDRIIVLALADAVPLPALVTAEVELAKDGMPLVVEDELLTDAPPVYVLADGTVMIPLRAVAEALGYQVDWDRPAVLLDGKPVLNIGEHGSVLRDNRTFVPLAFFKDVMKVNNAYIFEGQVEINNGEGIK